MMNQRDLRRAVRHGEHELRAAGGDVLSQLRPRNILRDARDLALKFVRDDVLQAYIAPRVWGVLPVVLVFVLVGTVCSIDVMIKTGRFVPGILALFVGAAVWARSEEHTSELQSHSDLVCRLLLEKKKGGTLFKNVAVDENLIQIGRSCHLAAANLALHHVVEGDARNTHMHEQHLPNQLAL